MLPTISLIIPVYNEEKALPLCLTSVMALAYPKDRLEVIVIDNNSTDASAAIIRSFPVRYLFEKRKGRSIARNAGMRSATGEILAFTDADCVVDAFWLHRLVQGFTAASIGCCGGKTVPYGTSRTNLFYARYQSRYRPGFEAENYFSEPLFLTCNMACRSELCRETGLFDEHLAASEDTDLAWRINLKGYQLKYVNEALVYHKSDLTFATFVPHFFFYLYWQQEVLRKYASLIPLSFNRAKIAFSPVSCLFRSLFFLARFKRDEAYYYFLCTELSLIVLAVWIWRGMRSIFAAKPATPVLPFTPASLVWRWGKDGNVRILNLRTRTSYYLDHVGSRIWELYNENRNMAEIIGVIKEEFEVTAEQVQKDVCETITEFNSEFPQLRNTLK